MPLDTKWTAAAIRDLTELWDTDKSAAEIASELGDDFSKNMVIGKARRLGLDARAPSRPRVKGNKESAASTETDEPISTPLAIVAPNVPEAVEPRNLSFAQIERFDCRWITNEDMTAPLYCGHSVVEGSSWCVYHKHVVQYGSAAISDGERERRREQGRAASRFWRKAGGPVKSRLGVLDEDAA